MVIFIIFCIVESAIGLFYYYRTQSEVNNYLNHISNVYRKIYESSIHKANITANNFYHYYLAKNNILDIFEEAYDLKPKERDLKRIQLLGILNKDITSYPHPNIAGINLVFPDNTMFLRSDAPDYYGENVSHRSIIALSKQNLMVYSGFDYGLTDVSYRYVIPIQNNGKYKGIIEIKLFENFFYDNYNSLPNTFSFTIMNKKIADSLIHPISKHTYQKISDNFNYVFDSVSHYQFSQASNLVSSKNQNKLSELIIKLFNDNKSVVIFPIKYIKTEQGYFIIKVIPLKSFTDSNLGYLVILNKNENITNLINTNVYHCIIISILILTFFILYIVRNNYTRKIKNNLDELHKSRNKLNQTLRELQKSQSELQEKQEFTAQINTLLREREKELEHLILEKDKFFSILSHDIKNPISGIMTDADVLNIYYDKMSDNDKKKSAERIQTAAKNLNKLVKEMMDWGMVKLNRLEVQEEQVHLKDIIEKVASQLSKSAEEKGDTISINCPTDLEIISDPDLLTIITRNLIQNSIKFTQNGRIEIICTLENGNAILKFKDTGIGIAFENLEKIFKIDKTLTTVGTNGEVGTGLGLLLVKDYVTKLGGEISINSMEGVGTTVTLILVNKNIT